MTLRERLALALVVMIVVSAFTWGFLWSFESMGKEGKCATWCAPYMHTFIQSRCYCSNHEGAYVPAAPAATER